MPDGNAYLLVAPPGYADGGLLGSLLARAGIGGPAETVSEKYARQDAERAGRAKAPAPAPAPAQPQTQLGGVNMNAMQRREAAAGLANGGPVVPEENRGESDVDDDSQPVVPENGVIEGPGGPTDDAIAAEMPTGSYVVPADVTQALVSDGEATLSPEVLAAASAAYFDVIKAALHTPAEQQPQSPAAPAFADGGLVEAGNIDLTNRPRVKNPDGSISTVKSMSIGTDRGEVLIPQVSDDGRMMTPEQAIGQFRASGQHLGIFKTPDAATAYAKQLHQQQAATLKQPARAPGFADGGTVEDDVNKIPTAGYRPAPAADGSQSNPFTNNELGRNVANTANALPGLASMRAGAGAARAATAGAGAGAVATTERAIPATWEVVNDASGPLARAAAKAPPIPTLPGAAGQLSTVGSSAAPAAGRAFPQIPGGASTALQTVEGGVRGASNVVAPQITQPQSLARQALGSPALQAGRTSPAALAAGTGAGVVLGMAGDTGTSPMGRIPGGTQPYSDARNGTGGYDPRAATASAASGMQPANPNNITRSGNSYTGGPNITSEGLTINGVKPAPLGITLANMAAADALDARERLASIGRLGAIPGGTDARALGSQVGWAGDPSNPQVYTQTAADRLTAGGFGAMRGTPELYRAKYGETAFRDGIKDEQKSIDDNTQIAAQSRAVTQREAGENARTLIKEQGDTTRSNIAARGALDAATVRARAAGAKAPEGYQWSADGKTMLAIPGGPADLKNSKESAQQGKDTQDIFSIIDQARKPLQTATNSTLGNVYDKTKQAFGGTTQGAESAAELKVLQGALISKMPKMSGPQSDKDVQLYREMAGQIGDPTIPREIRAKALDQIQALNEKYLPAPVGQDDYGKLASGSTYRAPDGSIRRKP